MCRYIWTNSARIRKFEFKEYVINDNIPTDDLWTERHYKNTPAHYKL